MSGITYEQARADHDYLWKTYGPAEDMSGAYVDQDDLEKLLRKPTKATARQCYEDQIRYWLRQGPEKDSLHKHEDRIRNDPHVAEIADRYYADVEFLD